MTAPQVSRGECEQACDAAIRLVETVRVIRDAGFPLGVMAGWRSWIPKANQIESVLADARAKIERVLPVIRIVTTGKAIVRCGHLAAPTAHDLALELGEHAQRVLAHVAETNHHGGPFSEIDHDLVFQMMQAIGVPSQYEWNGLTAELKREWIDLSEYLELPGGSSNGSEVFDKVQAPLEGSPPTMEKERVRFSNWGFGFDGKQWWVFHRFQDRKVRTSAGKLEPLWAQRGRWTEIPKKGRTRVMLKALAENGGSLAKKDAIKLFPKDEAARKQGERAGVVSRSGSSKRGWDDDRIMNSVVVPTRHHIAKAVKDALSRVAKQHVDGNPIPYERGCWVSEVRIGYAVKDDDGKLVLRTQEELTTEERIDVVK